ncbi:hypothetical protein ACFC8N_34140 [Streptomyces sp. NPDC055966]|uniref:hypothetical protein n=1 Tax=Streptomyces sp. NPDC055966 TaxID=3345669 RepID=UPI0035D8F71C
MKVGIVLDTVHAIDKLWAAARCFHTATDPPQALAKGWPIASGVIEGACRHLISNNHCEEYWALPHRPGDRTHPRGH